MDDKLVYEFLLNGIPFRLETGEIANHAQSSFLVSYGETAVLITVSVGNANPELDFFPLTVDYVEKLYAGGLISSSPFIKREGRPTDHEILNARLIDHAIRSLFPSNYRNETQVICQVISYDKENDPVLASIIGVSFALSYSGIPFLGPYGATKVGLIDGEIVLNPTLSQDDNSKLHMFVSSVENDGIVSVEAEAHDISEDIIKDAIRKSIQANNFLIEEQKRFIEKHGKKDFEFEAIEDTNLISEEIYEKFNSKLEEAIYIFDKTARGKAISSIKKEVEELFAERVEKEEILQTAINTAFDKVLKKIVRRNILGSGKRPDGRKIDEVRPLSMRVGVLPRVHGSALFTRGETQTLSIVTLGSERDALIFQNMEGESSKRYFHHYNMPGYANGEVDRKLGMANRRAIGHGTIGEKALENMIAPKEEFPYTIRVVSEVTSSNGSTSMAATCSSTLALMDAGVPVSKVIGGIGIGLVYESAENYKVVTDIIGMEDFYGDMDFKITGSTDGITAIQLDNKMSGIPQEILFEAIDRSKVARLVVIESMEKCISKSRTETSKYAPKVKQIKIDPDQIGGLIGSGGKTIKSITEKCNVEINIEDTGDVTIYAKSDADFEKALRMISLTLGNLNPGEEFEANIVRVESFGLIIELAGTDIQGLVHVSSLGLGYVKDLKEVMQPGSTMKVKFVGKDERGRLKFAKADINSNEK